MDAHEREYAAAVSGMADTYGRIHKIGDRVTWRSSDWPDGVSMTGEITAIDGPRFVILDDLVEYRVEPSEILPF